MYTFALQEIKEIDGKLKIFKLLIDGECSYDEFEMEIKNEGNLKSELITIGTKLHEIADCKSLPEKKFRDITLKNGDNKEYEIKTHHLRVYLFHEKNTGRIIVCGGKKCSFRTTLRSGTVMHGSKLPFRYWFIAMHLLTSTKKSFSAKEIQRQLSHKRYEPIWGMLHKLRQAMGKRDEQYQLSGSIELDEGFFSTEIPDKEKDKPLKRGRGSQKKTKVLVMAESKAIEGETKKNGKPRKVRFIKMQVITDLKADTITSIVKKDVSFNSELITDDSTSYVKLKDVVDKHEAQVIPKEKIGSVLPWVHIAISNAKRMLLDIHHDIKPEHLQNYLNEFCYNFNRRYFGEALFDRLLVASISHKNQFRYN